MLSFTVARNRPLTYKLTRI